MPHAQPLCDGSGHQLGDLPDFASPPLSDALRRQAEEALERFLQCYREATKPSWTAAGVQGERVESYYRQFGNTTMMTRGILHVHPLKGDSERRPPLETDSLMEFLWDPMTLKDYDYLCNRVYQLATIEPSRTQEDRLIEGGGSSELQPVDSLIDVCYIQHFSPMPLFAPRDYGALRVRKRLSATEEVQVITECDAVPMDQAGEYSRGRIHLVGFHCSVRQSHGDHGTPRCSAPHNDSAESSPERPVSSVGGRSDFVMTYVEQVDAKAPVPEWIQFPVKMQHLRILEMIVKKARERIANEQRGCPSIGNASK